MEVKKDVVVKQFHVVKTGEDEDIFVLDDQNHLWRSVDHGKT